MAGYHVPPLDKLVEQFEQLPGIGSKTAQRLAYFVLNLPKEKAKEFADSIVSAHEKIHYCKVCCNLTDGELCPICRNEARDRSVICVVEDPRDVFAFERTHEFKATYHVLHGAISPLSGIGPEQLCMSAGRHRSGSDHGNESHRRGRGNRNVSFSALEALGH